MQEPGPGNTKASSSPVDNPLIAANLKAKKLRSLLERQKVIQKSRPRFPFIEALVFCSAPGLQCELTGTAGCGYAFAIAKRRR